jgi:hypothetical protein
MGTAAAALGANAASSQVVSTAEAVTAAVRRELTSGIDPNKISETLQSSLGNLQLPKLDFDDIRGQFEKLLGSSDLQSIAGSDLLKNVDRQTFVDLVSNRTDLSKQDINKLADQLEGAWKQVVGQQGQDPQAQLLNFLKSATPEQLQSNELGNQLSQLIKSGQGQSTSLTNKAMQLGFNTLLGTVLDRVDLSDVDVEKISAQLQKVTDKLPGVDVEQISGQLQKLKDQATEQANKVGSQVADQATKVASQVADKSPALPFSTIKADVDNYLLNSYAWHLNRETIKQEFQDVIYDPEADPGTVRRQLEQINREYFIQKLTSRGDLLPDKINELAEQLESIRMEVFNNVQGAESQGRSQDVRSRVENYLRSTGKEELNPEGIQANFQTLLEDPEAGLEALSDRLSQFDRDTLVNYWVNVRISAKRKQIKSLVSLKVAVILS